ncbi:MAG TPA: DUF2283 domain-containing protein, partial [Dehalococcoidia bacterium]
IRLQHDRRNNLLYIAISERAFERGLVAQTVRVTDNIAVDLSDDGQLIGIDVMSAESVIGRVHPAEDELVGVKEAAAILGVKKPNFVRDFASSPSFPAPVAELATGRVWMKDAVEKFARARSSKHGAKRTLTRKSA